MARKKVDIDKLRDEVSKAIVDYVDSLVPPEETPLFTVSGGMDSTFLFLTYKKYGKRPCKGIAAKLRPPYVNISAEYDNLMKIEHLIDYWISEGEIIKGDYFVPTLFQSVPNPIFFPCIIERSKMLGYKNLIVGEGGDALFGEGIIKKGGVSFFIQLWTILKRRLFINSLKALIEIWRLLLYKIFPKKYTLKHSKRYSQFLERVFNEFSGIVVVFPFAGNDLVRRVLLDYYYTVGLRKSMLRDLLVPYSKRFNLEFENPKINFEKIIMLYNEEKLRKTGLKTDR